MGRTFVDVEVANCYDLDARESGGNGRTRVRKLKVRALVDTGSALLCLPAADIRKLGLRRDRSTTVRTANGVVERSIYRAVQITILGRHCIAEVMEIPKDVPPLLGFIPLESLDLVVNPKSNQVTHNPENGGKYTLDLL
ncbi:MAG TPA: aspartyl protease family protein [Planctomycetota bacterium]|nr:aspartyl protease family protein [Planctomycetota bacterium]